ncbi:MAG TPA: hypothetical protein VNW94_03805, partial [Streptosporangiaceae bacterium]|nr:hypothetical protein [Streptosporangiaceae bacterium]
MIGFRLGLALAGVGTVPVEGTEGVRIGNGRLVGGRYAWRAGGRCVGVGCAGIVLGDGRAWDGVVAGASGRVCVPAGRVTIAETAISTSAVAAATA